MRKLLYVPAIHMEPDLGSLAPSINRASASLYREERWARHREIVRLFWQRIADYVSRVDSSHLKVYQDGLPAGGELGRRIIEEGAKNGSTNHQIILDLLTRGAELRRTEDPALLKEEYRRIARLARSRWPLSRLLAYIGYRVGQARLLEERDRFIARTINDTLKDGEMAILFIGAYHRVIPYLAQDIVVEQVKEQERMVAYLKELTGGRDKARLQQLAQYLIAEPSPVLPPPAR